MSWDADLIDDRGHNEGSWNFTHNCNGMIAAAMETLGQPRPPEASRILPIGPAWWYSLDGKSGPEGKAFLAGIIGALEADPLHFKAMNPANGWGSYEQLLETLRSMRDAVPAWPTTWSANG